MRIHFVLTRYALITAAFFVAGCDAGASEDAPQGLTEGERDRLEAAAERLDSRPAGPGADGAAALEAETRERLANERAQQGAAER